MNLESHYREVMAMKRSVGGFGIGVAIAGGAMVPVAQNLESVALFAFSIIACAVGILIYAGYRISSML